MANTFRKVYKKTGNSGTSSDYQLVGNIGVNGVELDIMKGASSSISGEIGLVPKPLSGQENSLLVWSATIDIPFEVIPPGYNVILPLCIILPPGLLIYKLLAYIPVNLWLVSPILIVFVVDGYIFPENSPPAVGINGNSPKFS